MKRILALILACLYVLPAQAQETNTLYLPLITKSGGCMLMTDPILRVTDGTKVIDLLGADSGWELADPYWQPQIAQFKGGGEYSNSGMAEGQQLTHREYDNVEETIPLSVRGIDQGRAIQTIRDLLQLGRQASDYWTESYEYDDVWLEVKPACDNSLTGYSRIVKMSIPELKNPFGQPFFSSYSQPVMEDISLIIEREPFWRGTPPGEIIGPLYNLIKNPDFELWNFGTSDSQPDSWNDLETLWIIGQNSRDKNPKWNDYDLKIRVSGSTAANAYKGVSQIIDNIKDETEYTVIAWVRSDGISNGVGRILVTYSGQLELYRSSTAHGWTLYTGKITTDVGDVVAINCEILTTNANTDGTIYIDGLMFIEGDWEEEAENNILPYTTSGHIVNHIDVVPGKIEAGDINYVDVWNIPGDVDALTKLEVMNNTPPTDKNNPDAVFSKIRIGQRRTKNVKLFDNILDPNGILDTTCSSDNRIDTSVNNGWKNISSKIVLGADLVENSSGRFRVFARVYDNKATPTNLQTKLVYWIGREGVGQKELNTVTSPVAQQWTILDLTPTQAMNIDIKGSQTIPGTFGYTISQRRTASGANDSRFDYALVMPTDGGYIEANLSPSALYKETFSVNNTGSREVIVKGVESGSIVPRFYTNQYISSRHTLAEFQNILYLGTFQIGGNPAGIWRWVDNVWTQLLSIVNCYVTTLEVYNDKLYAGGIFDMISPGVKVSTDGVSFSSAWTTGSGNITPYVLRSFNGLLWMAYYNSVGLDTTVYSYNGTAVSALSLTVAGAIPLDMIVANNKLYLFLSNGELYEYSTVWTLIATLPGMAGDTGALELFNWDLYVSGMGDVYRLDGTNLTKVYEGGTIYVESIDLETFNNKLYGIIQEDVGTNIKHRIIETSDGDTWTTTLSTNYGLSILYGFNGILFTNQQTQQYISSIVLQDSMFSVADYQGGPFTSPPEKRHRWFFNWDRENYINNVDDKALIGLGIVPRYLSLINYP